MFCKHCGNELNNNAIVCMKCGCDPNTGGSFCPNCGANTNEHQIACIKCGCPLNAAAGERSGQKRKSKKTAKSKVTAGVLAILLGMFGVHQFYLGNVGSGILRNVITFVGTIFCAIGFVVTGIFGLIEGIMYLCMSDEEFDEKYVQHKRGWF